MNDGERKKKEREAVDGKRRIDVHLVLGAKPREGTGGEGAAKRELPIKTRSESPGGGGAGRVTSP